MIDKHQKFAALCLGMLFAACVLSPLVAHAQEFTTHPPLNTPSYVVDLYGISDGQGASPFEACQNIADYFTAATSGSTHVVDSVSTTQCTWKRLSNGNTGTAPVLTVVASECHVDDDYDANTGMCLHPDDPPVCTLDTPPVYYIETAPALLNYSPDGLVCGGGCLYGYRNSVFDDSNGSVQNNYVPTGSECSGEETERNLQTADEEIEEEGFDCNTFENVIMCWPDDANGQRNDPQKCYVNNGGAAGAPIKCPPDTEDINSGDDERCGFVAGDYYCIDTGDDKTCGLVNGELRCFPKGNGGKPAPVPVSADSPDNPLNGGNADGNDKNDIFRDAVDAASNGMSSSDIKKEMQRRAIADAYKDSASGRGGTAGAGGDGEGFDDSGIIDAINGQTEALEGMLTGAPFQGPYSDGVLDVGAVQGFGEVAKAEYESALATIKAESANLFAVNLSDVGSLPCRSFDVWGEAYDVCVSDFDTDLAPIGDFLVFLTFVAGSFLIMRP